MCTARLCEFGIGDAEVIIEHEISHALYSITGQTDNTHKFFYANQFSRVLTDIAFPNQSAIQQKASPKMFTINGVEEVFAASTPISTAGNICSTASRRSVVDRCGL